MRTSLALASAGVGTWWSVRDLCKGVTHILLPIALVQLFNIATDSHSDKVIKLRRIARPLGAGVVGLGALLLVIGSYFSQRCSIPL